MPKSMRHHGQVNTPLQSYFFCVSFLTYNDKVFQSHLSQPANSELSLKFDLFIKIIEHDQNPDNGRDEGRGEMYNILLCIFKSYKNPTS